MRSGRTIGVAALCALALSGPASAALPGPPQLAADRATFLQAAKTGVAAAKRYWWDGKAKWYRDRLDPGWNRPKPLARLWTAFPLFETLNAIAIAEPTAANKAAVRAFATGARRYWNPSVSGYAYYPGTNRPVDTYFDDDGWWAIAFLDAYRATGDRAYLADATKAFDFIVRKGWDAGGGGVWWDTQHHHKTAEPLAAAAFVGAELYRITRKPVYLTWARRLVAWADSHSWNSQRSLYQRSATSDVVMDYVEGMMIGAELELCRITGSKAGCAKAERLARASLVAFPADANWNPVSDGIYLRFMLDLYAYDRNPRWYELAYRNAKRALANARSTNGLFLKDWSGKPYQGGLLWSHAGSLSLLAWLAAAPLPKV